MRAVLWYQGETDALSDLTAASYGERAAAALPALRAAVGGDDATPLVVVAIAAAPAFVARVGSPFERVRTATLALPDKLPATAAVDAASISPGFMPDGIHLDAASQVALGRRLAAAVEEVERRERKKGGA